jgi:uncharacterized protein (DUF4415 family)
MVSEPVFDEENPEWTEEDFARAKPASEVLPKTLFEALTRRGPQKAPTKRAVSLRLDPEVVNHFKATGRGWQSRINGVLLDAISHKRA